MIYRRRKYGKDVVIYTKQAGAYLLLPVHSFNDPWALSGKLIDLLNKHQKE